MVDSMRFRTVLPAALLTFVALSACGDDTDDAATTAPVAATEVAVVDNDFKPATIRVDTGTTVTWKWKGSAPHDVRGDGFGSKIQNSGTFQHTFATPGEYEYRCTVHREMQGRVVVG